MRGDRSGGEAKTHSTPSPPWRLPGDSNRGLGFRPLLRGRWRPPPWEPISQTLHLARKVQIVNRAGTTHPGNPCQCNLAGGGKCQVCVRKRKRRSTKSMIRKSTKSVPIRIAYPSLIKHQTRKLSRCFAGDHQPRAHRGRKLMREHETTKNIWQKQMESNRKTLKISINFSTDDPISKLSG